MQYKLYKDGTRLLVVFEQSTPDLEREIEQRLGEQPVAVKQISGIAPPTPMQIVENRPQMAATNAVPPSINPMQLLQEKGFLGFCSIYSYYNQYRDILASPCRKNLADIIRQQTQFLRNRNVETMSDDELKTVLKYGGQYLFPNSMKSCLQQSGYASVEDFLESGRTNLIDAYLACVVESSSH